MVQRMTDENTDGEAFREAVEQADEGDTMVWDESSHSRRERVKDIARIVSGGSLTTESVASAGTVGTQDNPVDLFLTADTMDWLFNVLGDDGEAVIDELVLETERGTITATASDGSIELTLDNPDP